MTTNRNTRLFYQHDYITTEVGGSSPRSIFRHKTGLLAQVTPGADASKSILVVNSNDSVLTKFEQAGKEKLSYTPYGGLSSQKLFNNPLALNGERLISIADSYMLGNGYRAFGPALLRFRSPDDLSPFGKGGLSAYAYCAGDPVNCADPTGHMSFRIHPRAKNAIGSVGLYASIVGIVLAIAGGATKSKKLSVAALALMGTGILAKSSTFFMKSRIQQMAGGPSPLQSVPLTRLAPSGRAPSPQRRPFQASPRTLQAPLAPALSPQSRPRLSSDTSTDLPPDYSTVMKYPLSTDTPRGSQSSLPSYEQITMAELSRTIRNTTTPPF